MIREIDLTEISDGRLYTAADMVKIGCNDCAGCSECCRTVGDTIHLDPYDIYQMEKALDKGFEELLGTVMELGVVDGLICPKLRILPENKGCVLLSQEGRCSIHEYRPGFCRMFPMGRVYEEEGFRYFLQVHECPYPNKTKLKLKKWLGIPELPKYESYINAWHSLQKQAREMISSTQNDEISKNLNLYLLQAFFVKPYEMAAYPSGFYPQMEERFKAAWERIKMYE